MTVNHWGLFIAFMMFVIAFCQLKIASSKIKLDLYNKRFRIYESVLNLYQQIWDWEEEKIKPLENDLIRSLRECKYLFDEKDEIYETVLKIKDANAKISGYYRQKNELEEGSNKELFVILHQNKVNGQDEYEKTIYVLEEKLKKYLRFKNTNGLNFWLSNII